MFLMLIFYSLYSSAEITICNKNVLTELMVFFFPVLPTVDVKMQAVNCRTNNTSAVVKHLAGCSCKRNVFDR